MAAAFSQFQIYQINLDFNNFENKQSQFNTQAMETLSSLDPQIDRNSSIVQNVNDFQRETDRALGILKKAVGYNSKSNEVLKTDIKIFFKD